MPLHPDSRIARSGRHPDLAAGGLVGNRDRFDRSLMREAQDLAQLARLSPPETPPAASEYSGITDAVNMLGLPASKTIMARNVVQDVIDDVKAMLTIAKSAREGGIPQEAIPELLRVGLQLRYRKNSDLAKAGALPEGSERVWGGRPFVKQGGQWKPKSKGKAKGVQAGGAGGAQKAPRGGAPRAGGEDAAPASTPKPDRHMEPGERFKGIKKKAKAAGKTIHGDFKGDTHGHEHMDELEQKLAQHVADGIRRKHGAEELAGEPGAEGGGPPDAGAAGPPQGEPPKDAAGRPTGHDKPEEPHEAARQTQGAHDLMDSLGEVENRLDSAHMRGVYDQLMGEGKQVIKDPSPQANEWYRNRVLSFLVLVTGAAAGAAMGDPGGALAGGVHGQQTQVTAGQASAAAETARRAGEASTKMAEKVKPKPKSKLEKPKPKPKPEETKKAMVALTRDGRLVLIKAKVAKTEPPEEEDEEEEEEEEEDPAAAEAKKEEEATDKAVFGDPSPDRSLASGRVGGEAMALSKGRVPPPPPPSKRFVFQTRSRVSPGLRKGHRAPHPKNEYGHRDDLEPGMVLAPRERHVDQGVVTVLDGGRFQVGDSIFRGGQALLIALHGSSDHHTTIRRYFRMGGERQPWPQVDVLEPLQALVKAEGVLVQRAGQGYALTGDLAKAGVPAYMLDEQSPQHTELEYAAAIDLCRFLAKAANA